MKIRSLGRLALFFLLFYGGYSCVKNGEGGYVVPRVNKERIASLLGSDVTLGKFPETIDLDGKTTRVDYRINPVQQRYMERTLRQYAPDYAAFVALDAETGGILTLSSYSQVQNDMGNLALKASFPAASIFKVVTAAAALDQNKMDPETLIQYNGANHTLYRRNVIQNDVNRWTRRISLRDAFARSVNTVFGKIGIFFLKPADLEDYAQRFQFNQTITSDVPVEPGTFLLNPEDNFGIAEAASGYSRLALMSPLQGAMMASSLINNGIMMEPYLVEQLVAEGEEVIYRAMKKPVAVTVTQKTAMELKRLMETTVKSGTSRTSFRDFSRRLRHLNLELGGKTGSLSGNSPKGKYDWFVGYASDGNHRIALCALTINEENWKVKSSYLARLYIENYFKALHPTTKKPIRETASGRLD